MIKFIISIGTVLSIILVYANSKSLSDSLNSANDSTKANISAASKMTFNFNSQLKWKEELSEFSSKNSLHYLLMDDDSIGIDVEFIENKELFVQLLKKEDSEIIEELIEGKNSVNLFVNYKKVILKRSKIVRDLDRIEVFLEGHYSAMQKTKYFYEKYFVFSNGILMISLDWNLKSKKNLIEIAKKDFTQIEVNIE